MKALRPFSMAALPLLLASCYFMPYPDHHLTRKDAAWGKVKRGEPYVLLKDFRAYPDHAALRDSSCAGVDEVGVLKKGTVIKFTGFCVRRNYWGAQPFVYAEVMNGEFAGKTIDAESLLQTATTYEGRRSWIEDIDHQALRASPASQAEAGLPGGSGGR